MSKGDAPKIQETPEEQVAAKVAMERWQHFQQYGVPNENLLMQKVNNLGTGEAHQVEGQTAGAIHDQFAPAIERVDTTLHQAGVNPASGRAIAADQDLYGQEGRALGLGTTTAGNQVENLHYRGLESIVNMGLGIKDNAQLGLGSVAAQSASAAQNDAFQSQYERAARSQGIGQGVGAFAAYGLPYVSDWANGGAGE